MDTPESRAKVLEAEADVVKKYLGSLPPEAWQQPSACEGWTVADVVGHLARQPFALRVNRGLQGDFSSPEGLPPVADHDEDRFAQDIFQRAKSANEEYGDQLLEILNQRLAKDVEIFNSVDPKDWETLCYWPPGPEPVRTLLDMSISELTMHAWDIRSILYDQYHLSEDSVRVLIDTVDRAVRRAFRPDPSLERPIRHRFVMTDPVSTSRDVVLAAEGARVEPAGSNAADVTFRCDGEAYVLVMYGRLKPEAAMADGRLTFEGDAELAAGFGRRFVGG